MDSTEGPNKEKKKVKKNTWLRKLKALDLRLDRRQRETPVGPEGEEVAHVCTNCGKEFSGRFCPQCGQDASWNSFSWKQERQNILEYLGLGKQAVSKTVNKVFKRKPKQPKRIKKNTWRRNLRALDLRLDRQQQVRKTIPNVDVTMRQCSNCGGEYTGRFCPQCGQSGIWSRYTWRQAFLNFLDIWGLGNRPMFRTIKELFWRPGYMVHDYLKGHRQFYFPPFKLLAVMVVITMFAYFLTGQTFTSEFASLGELLDNINPPAFIESFMPLIKRLVGFLSNPLYSIIASTIGLVFFIRFAFGRTGGYNIIEIFIFLIYISSMSLMVDLPSIFFNGICHVSNHYVFSSLKQSSPSLYTTLYQAGSACSSLIKFICSVLTVYLTVLSFRQFFGLSWKSTIKRLLFAGFIILMVIIALVLLGNAVLVGSTHFVISLLLIAVGSTACYFTFSYIHRNKAVLNRKVYLISFFLAVWAYMTLFVVLCAVTAKEDYGMMYMKVRSLYEMAIGGVIIIASSILPVFLYKKYHKTWLAFLPYLILLIITIAYTS
ncbi:MAG: DUF3667 domain-containing protein [Muribaculaceae bacterium]|nr:DUF3667 domain-containing protein [Muribaculaceae bacterium]